MRFVTYASPAGGDRVGLVVDDQVLGLEPRVTLLDLLDADDLAAAGERAATAPSETLPLEGLTLRAPLQPRSIRDCTGFLQHLRNCQGAADIPVDERHNQFPAFYFSNVAAVIGPHDDVAISPGSEKFDYELEIAAVIGRAGSNILLHRAESHIAGYLLLCDWSARDLQINEMAMQLGPAKGKDGANTLGPMLVTPDEIEPFRSRNAFDLGMAGYVNDELVSEGRWDSIDWGFPDMITYTSRGTTLRPGDVIGSGTVPSGCLFEHFAMNPDEFRGWLQPGDVVRLVVEQLGEIRHRVIEGEKPQPLSSGF
ncbi:fumarylacetoacetate hydrolase family protein [Saccharopolyspora sp. WRP15-2]|uniref:Fumarylacetoacetate hydrolase family protein n=1 Tax=Saccharopolyspora oryzae TaxID=2997343 RepID=A0ABT4UUS8_9PSEU|nr:fumarylacetoacetate hydrolase family protein [Saccharopolyspora oryzae]MDA3625477.1 fumarylacetoacetate hydrolase family protein [Saccharopolyspora oryzae]